MASEQTADQALVLELHQVLSEIDPVRWHDDAAAALRTRLVELQQRLRQRERLAALAGELEHQLPGPDAAPDTRDRWLAFKKSLQPAYEAIATSLRAEKIHVPSLRPTNWARSLFHVTGAAVSVLLIEILSPTWLTCAALLYAGTFWCLELGRRRSDAMNAALLKFFRHVVHSHEAKRVNSSTWYATALVLLTLTRSPVLCLVGVGVLGVGDPLAAFIGRRFGRVRLIHGRSLEGSLAFFASGALVALALLRAFQPELGFGPALAIAAAGAFCGALAELFSLRIDDNLSVPVAAAAGAALVMFAV
jgi:dolichol kinase